MALVGAIEDGAAVQQQGRARQPDRAAQAAGPACYLVITPLPPPCRQPDRAAQAAGGRAQGEVRVRVRVRARVRVSLTLTLTLILTLTLTLTLT